MSNEITKRKVTMTNVVYAGQNADGEDLFQKQIATDYVRPDFLDAYVADARTRWQHVEVSDEPDAGPGGYGGQTSVPNGIDHELAGATFAATDEEAE